MRTVQNESEGMSQDVCHPSHDSFRNRQRILQMIYRTEWGWVKWTTIQISTLLKGSVGQLFSQLTLSFNIKISWLSSFNANSDNWFFHWQL